MTNTDNNFLIDEDTEPKFHEPEHFSEEEDQLLKESFQDIDRIDPWAPILPSLIMLAALNELGL